MNIRRLSYKTVGQENRQEAVEGKKTTYLPSSNSVSDCNKLVGKYVF